MPDAELFASGQEVFISVFQQVCVLDVCAWVCPVASQHRVPISHPSLTLSCLDAQPPSPPRNLCLAIQL